MFIIFANFDRIFFAEIELFFTIFHLLLLLLVRAEDDNEIVSVVEFLVNNFCLCCVTYQKEAEEFRLGGCVRQGYRGRGCRDTDLCVAAVDKLEEVLITQRKFLAKLLLVVSVG